MKTFYCLYRKIIYILYLSPIFIFLNVGSVYNGIDYCLMVLNNIPEGNRSCWNV